ncbi:MAG: PfkB family carbohydrate kinase [Candidatus Omnitrophica bacterium]|nr:PfkB family carbohydrate kinase [Candidatus Omnitrophota bacterium]MCM8793294.1 PfkB family carbohydrate kinase [Candidatus Omnitrophota bacterium]
MEREKTILVVGSVALDTIETPSELRKDILGGSAIYFSLAGSYFTLIRIVGVIGEDMPAHKLFPLRKKNIDLKGLEKRKGKTFRWWGKYEEDFNRRKTVKLELNVFRDFSPYIVFPHNHTPYVFLANIDPSLQRNILIQIRNKKVVGSDTIDHWIMHKPGELISLLKEIDIFFLNAEEAKLFSQSSNLYRAARWVAKKGPKVVVIKKGEDGALMLYRQRFFSCPAFPVEKVVDPTGAGDAFAGGFMGYLSGFRRIDERILRGATVYGIIMGSFAVESFGPARFFALNLAEIKERFFLFKRIFDLSI